MEALEEELQEQVLEVLVLLDKEIMEEQLLLLLVVLQVCMVVEVEEPLEQDRMVEIKVVVEEEQV